MDSSQKESQTASPDGPREEERRSFILKIWAIVIGAFTGLVPVATGIYAFFDPLKRTGEAASFTKITTLDAIPTNGVPVPFPVIKESTQTFTRFPREPVGRVFLRQVTSESGEVTVEAFHATCPHAGCYVEYDSEGGEYGCPCHNSKFEQNGARIDPDTCPAPRNLDTLKVEVKDAKQGQSKEVWVEFVNYRAGIRDKIPK